MRRDAADLSADFAGYCGDLLDRAAQTALMGGRRYRAGLAEFTLWETEVVETPWANAQFPGADSANDCPPIYLGYDGLEDSPMRRLLDRLGYTDIQTLFGEIGCSGFYHADRGHLEFYDPARRAGLRILPDTASCPAWESTAPLANFVAWMNAGLGGVMLHAASLATATRGALICGRGGSGKSLLTLAGVLAGLDSVGDDYVIVGRDSGRFLAWQCALTAKQTPTGLDMLGPAGDRFRTGPLNWQSKFVFPLPERPTDRPVPIDMVIVPTIGSKPGITDARRPEVFRHLTESTIYQLSGNSAAVAGICGDILRNCPSYRFEMGPDIAANVACLRGFLSDGPRP